MNPPIAPTRPLRAGRARRALGVAVAAAASAAIACAVDAPVLHGPLPQGVYASKYFEVDAPAGSGWSASLETAQLPAREERDLFVPWIPPRIAFTRHDWGELWPHGDRAEPTLEFASEPLGRADEAPRASWAWGPGRPLPGEVALAGRRWRAYLLIETPDVRWIELRSEASELGVLLRVRLLAPADSRELPPRELAAVIDGLRARRVTVAPEELEIERGVSALGELSKQARRVSFPLDPELVAFARTGIERLAASHPERFEAPLFSAGLELLSARVPGLSSGQDAGPFDVAFEMGKGHVGTTAIEGAYDAEAVVQATRRALEREPDSFWARYYLGCALARAGQAALGAQQLEVLSAKHPESALAWFALALVRREAGDAPGARVAARRAAAENAKRETFGSYGTGWFGSTLVDRLLDDL